MRIIPHIGVSERAATYYAHIPQDLPAKCQLPDIWSEKCAFPLTARIVVQQSTDVIATKNELLRAALRFIRENIGRSFGAAEIAASLGVPRIRLDRLFAAELRRSGGKEILRQRLAKAKQLLTETDGTLDAIASSCGFCHASYLVNAFKKALGTTPRRYRKSAICRAVPPRAAEPSR